MERANKTYGFTIAVKELKETVPNIFRYASAYKRKNNITSKGLWEMFAEPAEVPESLPADDPKYKPQLPEEILSTEAGHAGLPDVDPDAMEGEVYNMCHFWSNFEIARLDWFRSKEYNEFFDMMDRSGGFWMERVCKESSVMTSPFQTNGFSVGRRSHSFPGSWCTALPFRYTLFPRHWLPTYHHSALPSQCTRESTARPTFIFGDDDNG